MRRPSPLKLAPITFFLLLAPLPALAIDTDGDGIDDPFDNCTLVANNQLDSDLDGFGNACDADYVATGGVQPGDNLTGGPDFAVLAGRWGCRWDDGTGCWDALAAAVDSNDDGVIGGPEFATFVTYFGKSPGPSGLACTFSVPCTPPVPLPGLPVVQAKPADYSAGYDQAAIDSALVACGAGCNLQLLASVYEDIVMIVGAFPDGFAMFGFRDNLDVDDLDDIGESVLRAPLFHDLGHAWASLIHISAAAPDGMIFQDFTLDGRKHEQLPPIDTVSQAPDTIADQELVTLSTGFWGLDNDDRANGTVQRLTVRDFASTGISLGNMTNWLVDENDVAGIGCNQLYEKCGDQITAPEGVLNWDDLDDAGSNPPGNKRSGIGIIIQDGSSDSIATNNAIERCTKFGLEIFGNFCSHSNATRRVRLRDNVVRNSREGIVLNGGCEHTIDSNEVYDSFIAHGSYAGPFGWGFQCGKGLGTVWTNNHAEGGAVGGYALHCVSDDIIFTGNVSVNNCVFSGQVLPNPQGTDLSVFGGIPDETVQPERLDIEDFTSIGGLCRAAIEIRRRSDVHIWNSNLEGGQDYGIIITETSDFEIETTTFTSSQAAGAGDIGVWFNRYQDNPANQPFDPMANVLVQPTTTVSGYDSEYLFEAPLALNDGDDIAYCSDESPPPPGCDPP